MDDPWLGTLPFWNEVSAETQKIILENIQVRRLARGSCLYYGDKDAMEPMLVRSGQIRVFINAPQGGEMTLYRLCTGQLCVLHTSRMVQNLCMSVHLEIEKDTTVYALPIPLYEWLLAENPVARAITMEILEARFGEVMWLLNQLAFSNTAQRLAQVLLQRRRLEEDDTLTVTHEALSRDLGTAREMVTRLLDRFQQDGMVALSRGNIRLLDKKRLQEL